MATSTRTAESYNPHARPRRRVQTGRLAFILALVYASISIIYILASGHFAANFAVSQEQLERVEDFKGVTFVLVTSSLLFVLLYWFLERLRRREAQLEMQRAALLAAERDAATGVFAASVAHDLNNVLLITDVAISALEESHSLDANGLRQVQRLSKANTELNALSRRLSRISGRHLEDEICDMDLAVIIRETVALAQTHRKVRYCALSVETPASLPLTGNPSLIHQMVLNLIINAADAGDNCGRILVVALAGEATAVIQVNDDGPGIPPAIRKRVFEPFYTTKVDGTGLGLVSVKICADAHNGKVSVETSPLGGACIEVELANMQATSEPAAVSAPVAAKIVRPSRQDPVV